MASRAVTGADRFPYRAGALALVIVVGAALVAFAVSSSGLRGTPIGPHATVREFLDAALLRHDGEGACEFLTPEQRSRVGGPRGCALVLGRLPRHPLTGLGVSGGAQRVTVTGAGAPLTFRLVPLPVSRRPRAIGPASGWRIASGAERLAR